MTGTVHEPLAVQAVLAYLAHSGGRAPPGAAAAPLGPLLDREPVAAQDGPGQRTIAVLMLAFAPVKRAMPGVGLGPAGEAACRPPASRGERAAGAAVVRPSMRSLYLQMLVVGALCAYVFIFAGDPVAHLLYGAGFREMDPLVPAFGVLLYRDMPIGLTPRNVIVLATLLLAVIAGLSLSHLGAP